jgi:hypothetical protein
MGTRPLLFLCVLLRTPPPAVLQENYQGGGKKPARLFSTSAMSREPAGCCMDDGFQRYSPNTP